MAIAAEELVTVPILDARFAAQEAKFDAKLDRLRFHLVIAILLANVAFGSLGAAAIDAIKRVL